MSTVRASAPTPPRPRLPRWAVLPSLLLSACVTTGTARLSPAEQGRQHLEAGRATEALPLLEQAHAAAPDDLELARTLTLAHVRAGNTEAFLASLAQRTPGATVHYMRGLALFTRAADAGGPALESFRAAVAARPGEAELHHRLGLALLETERIPEAVPPLREAVTRAPERTRFRLPLAKALALTGKREEAVAQLAALVRAAPRPPPAEIELGRQLMVLVADPYAELPASVRPRIDEALEALQVRDQPQTAIVTFEEVLRDFPDLAVVRALLGLAWLRLDDAGRALDELRKASELAPWDGHHHLYLGNLYASRQRPERAAEAWRRAVELHPLLDEAWSRLGELELERGAMDAAIEALQVAVTLRQEAPEAHGRLALAYQSAGRAVEAEQALQGALALAPGSPELQLGMGVLLSERAETLSAGPERETLRTRARTHLQRVLELQPDNLVASRALEKLSPR